MRKISLLLFLLAIVVTLSCGVFAAEKSDDGFLPGTSLDVGPAGARVTLYKAKEGETVAAIAAAWNLGAAKLALANGLSIETALVENQILVLTEKALEFDLYAVVPGDTIYTVAAGHGVTAAAIVRLNRFSAYGAELRVGQTILIPPPGEPDMGRPAENDGDAVKALLAFANGLQGKAYVSGHTGPDAFDCSGFTYYVFQHCGKTLPRLSKAQATIGAYVKPENLLPGDLVFFSTPAGASVGHVGIYIGGGRFVHAVNVSRGVATDSLNSGYYAKHYITARRVSL